MKFKVGDVVRTVFTHWLVGSVAHPIPEGTVGVVKGIMSGRSLQVDFNGDVQYVFNEEV